MKRNVTIVTDAISRTRGGAEIYLAALAELITRHGHPVRVLSRRSCPDPLPAGVTLQLVNTGRTSGLLRELTFAKNVRHMLNGHRDVVLSTVPIAGATHYQPHSGVYRAGFTASGESLEAGLRKKFYRLGDRLNLKRRWLAAQQERLFADPHGPRIMTFSNAVRHQIKDQYGVSEKRITTLPLGVDLGRFRPRDNATSEPSKAQLVLLFAAHNFRLKGLHCLLAALSRAIEQGLDAELRIIGNGSPSPFRKELSQPSLVGRVHFLGPVSDQEMPHHYRLSDAIVHPTFSDHCSLVVLEALACGTPVITTHQNGAAELITPGGEGLIISQPRDLKGLTDALLLLRDQARVKEMRRAALAMRPRIDFSDHAQNVLEWLLDEHPSAERAESRSSLSHSRGAVSLSGAAHSYAVKMKGEE